MSGRTPNQPLFMLVFAAVLVVFLKACVGGPPTINQIAIISAKSIEVVSNDVTRLFANEKIGFDQAMSYFDKLDDLTDDVELTEQMLDACETPTCIESGELELKALKKILDGIESDLLGAEL